MAELPAMARRLCLAVDLESYSRRSDREQGEAQRRLAGLLDEAHQMAGSTRPDTHRQPNGDGEVVLVAPELDEGRFLADFVRETRVSLARTNSGLGADARLRLRLAAHFGLAWVGGNGFVGQAVVRTCRLVSSPPARAALRDNPGCDLVLVVSEGVFDDVIRHEPHDLPATSFVRARTEAPDKNFASDMWIWAADVGEGVVVVRGDHQPDRHLLERVVVPPTAPDDVDDGHGPRCAMTANVHSGGNVQTLVQVNELNGGLVVHAPLPPGTR